MSTYQEYLNVLHRQWANFFYPPLAWAGRPGRNVVPFAVVFRASLTGVLEHGPEPTLDEWVDGPLPFQHISQTSRIERLVSGDVSRVVGTVSDGPERSNHFAPRLARRLYTGGGGTGHTRVHQVLGEPVPLDSLGLLGASVWAMEFLKADDFGVAEMTNTGCFVAHCEVEAEASADSQRELFDRLVEAVAGLARRSQQTRSDRVEPIVFGSGETEGEEGVDERKANRNLFARKFADQPFNLEFSAEVGGASYIPRVYTVVPFLGGEEESDGFIASSLIAGDIRYHSRRRERTETMLHRQSESWSSLVLNDGMVTLMHSPVDSFNLPGLVYSLGNRLDQILLGRLTSHLILVLDEELARLESKPDATPDELREQIKELNVLDAAVTKLDNEYWRVSDVARTKSRQILDDYRSVTSDAEILASVKERVESLSRILDRRWEVSSEKSSRQLNMAIELIAGITVPTMAADSVTSLLGLDGSVKIAAWLTVFVLVLTALLIYFSAVLRRTSKFTK